MKFPLAALLFLGAAHAAPVWTLGPNESGESLVFHDQQGPCVGKAQVVVWSKPGNTPVPGCYRIEDGAVFVAFLDGDHMRPFPVGMLVKARSL